MHAANVLSGKIVTIEKWMKIMKSQQQKSDNLSLINSKKLVRASDLYYTKVQLGKMNL